MHLGYREKKHVNAPWGMIAVLTIGGLGFVAWVVFSDQLQELFVGLHGSLD